VGWGVEFFKPLGALVPVGCDDPSCDPALVDRFNYSNLRTALEARWRFLPKTAVVVDTQFNLRNYLQGPTPEALLFSARAGLAGLITPKISVTALLGYGKDFNAPATGEKPLGHRQRFGAEIGDGHLHAHIVGGGGESLLASQRHGEARNAVERFRIHFAYAGERRDRKESQCERGETG
jgi:hypothetical protein